MMLATQRHRIEQVLEQLDVLRPSLRQRAFRDDRERLRLRVVGSTPVDSVRRALRVLPGTYEREYGPIELVRLTRNGDCEDWAIRAAFLAWLCGAQRVEIAFGWIGSKVVHCQVVIDGVRTEAVPRGLRAACERWEVHSCPW